MKRSEQQEKAQKLLDIEVKNNLFDLVDKNGVHVWDVVRFGFGDKVIWDYSSVIDFPKKKSLTSRVKSIFLLIRSVLCFLNFRKYKTLSVTNSRNKLDNENFDQNQHDVINLLHKEDLIFLETQPILHSIYKNSYYLGFTLKIYGALSISNYTYYNFSKIIILFKDAFPYLNITDEQLNHRLKMFYLESSFYRYFIKRHSIKQVFFTQNGYMPGLLSAAKDLGVKTFEFQHGIVNEKHFLYSYPDSVDVQAKSYQPEYMLRFSDYWFSDFYAPFNKITMGNNYFLPSNTNKTRNKKSLLIISSKLISVKLSNFLTESLDKMKDWDIYYKLHPNEFNNVLYYQNKYQDNKNIHVISNQYSVTDLLGMCSTMLTIQSTAIYEALQSGCRVIIIDSGEYNELDVKNVYHITKSEELLKILNVDVETSTEVQIYFDRFNAKNIDKYITQ